MIVTVTPNPSLDLTIRVARLVRGDGHKAEETWTEPAGKGVNIARALAANDQPTHAVFPSGGSNGRELERLLGLGEIAFTAIPIDGSVRSNVSVIEPDGTVTKFNELGPELSEEETQALIEATVTSSKPGEWVAACGSLPRGMPIDFYARLARRLGEVGAKVAIDASGPPLEAALDGRPGLIKPNHHELGELVGHALPTLGEAVDAAREVSIAGPERVLVSLGQDGAVLIEGDSVLHGEVRVSSVQNSVGAGDALLAGFVAAGAVGEQALSGGLAWASAAVRSSQTAMAPVSDIDRSAVTIHGSIDRDRVLVEDSAGLVTLPGGETNR